MLERLVVQRIDVVLVQIEILHGGQIDEHVPGIEAEG